MIIPCLRCKRPIDTPNNLNADYVIAEDTKAVEDREVPMAFVHTEKTLADIAEAIKDIENPTPEFILNSFSLEDCDKVQVKGVVDAEEKYGDKVVAVVLEHHPTTVQKTGVICPDCYRPDDFVIWGVHKQETEGQADVGKI